MTALASCPFCDSADTATVYCGPTPEQIRHAIAWGNDYDVAWFVECKFCGASGRQHDTEAEAITAWNRRAPTALERAMLAYHDTAGTLSLLDARLAWEALEREIGKFREGQKS